MSENNGFDNDTGKPLLNVITSYREDFLEPIDWTIVPTVGEYGAGVDFAAGVLSIPLTGDEYSRRLQLRKVIEARVSPKNDKVLDQIASNYSEHGISPAMMRIAEQARINAIAEQFAKVKRIPSEPDGSEKKKGQQFATIGTHAAWDRAVEYAVSLAGTKAFDSFASGVRSVKPDWSERLRKLNKRLADYLDASAMDLGDTRPYAYGEDKDGAPIYGPRGLNYTISCASIISDYASSGVRAPDTVKRAKSDAEEKAATEYGEYKDPDEKGKLDPEGMPINSDEMPDDFEFPTDDRDQFAALVIDDNLPLSVEVDGYMKRRRRPAQIGRNVGDISRFYTDPERRIFKHKVKVKGGIVVVDISGSMSLSQEDVEAIVTAAPAAIIIAYSYTGHGVPNAWIFAKRGWRVRDIPYVGHSGNGVDGPALAWAVKQRHPGEPIVWISDGQVTTKNDGQNLEIIQQCAQLVKKHKIIMIPNAEEAVKMFKSGKLINKPTGPIRKALLGKL